MALEEDLLLNGWLLANILYAWISTLSNDIAFKSVQQFYPMSHITLSIGVLRHIVGVINSA
jgi:hypothetical protein